MNSRARIGDSAVVTRMADIQLFYFEIRARAELIRFMLHAAGQKFDDNIIPRASWPKGKEGENRLLGVSGEGRSHFVRVCFARLQRPL